MVFSLQKGISSVAAILTCGIAHAVIVSPWTPSTTPKYYYGTNNFVNYSARNESGERLKSIKLFVGGEQTKSLTNQSGLTKPMVIGVVFDSTHFGAGVAGAFVDCETHLEVEYEKLVGGSWVAQPTITNGGSTTIQIKNHALITTLGSVVPFSIANPDSPSGKKLADIIVDGDSGMMLDGEKAKLQAAHIYVNKLGPFLASGSPVLWTATDLANSTSPNHIVIVNTHGAQDLPKMADGAGSPNVEPGPWYSQIFANFGTDKKAPLNASAIPPINLLFLFSCFQGSYSDISGWGMELFPYGNEFRPGFTNEDQACIGFNVAINAYCISYISESILFNMGSANCMTLQEAAEAFVNSSDNFAITVASSIGTDGEPTGGLRKMTMDDIRIFGDKYMRIHGVYTGAFTSGATIGWWR